jgi:hypothetical protein
MEYKLLKFKDKQAIAKRQIKELEAQHFAFVLLEPSKLQDSANHVQWQQQLTGLEQQLDRFKKNVFKAGLSVEEEE